MEREQVTGKVDELKGKVKQGIGKATNNPDLQKAGSDVNDKSTTPEAEL